MDLTVVATPGYFGAMAAERRWLRRHAAERGPTPADYERRDTLASLSMGLGSLAVPLVLPRLLRHMAPGKGRYGKALLVTAATSAVVTTVADRLARLDPEGAAPDPESGGAPALHRAGRRRVAGVARRVAAVGGVTAVVTGGLALATSSARLTPKTMWNRRLGPDLGAGPAAVVAAVLGWDFVYYWNHRFMHECRALWAVHVVHHSSERYNLSTALRQPVADAFGVFLPYGALCLLGIRPALIETARGVNLLYQFWIHTDTIRTLGPLEGPLNTPSHHRVHHGSNRQYLDRNHGSILIVWDRLFGTFEPEDETVVYGLTRNIRTFQPARVALHEHLDMLGDVARSRTWRDRLSFVARGPGWSYRRRAELDGEPAPATPSPTARTPVAA